VPSRRPILPTRRSSSAAEFRYKAYDIVLKVVMMQDPKRAGIVSIVAAMLAPS
jgi:hypothetical protein